METCSAVKEDGSRCSYLAEAGSKYCDMHKGREDSTGNTDSCRAAAGGGQLEVLQRLRSQDPPCPWDEDTCSAAAKGGHLEVLRWLRSQQPPCPWDPVSCKGLASNHIHVVAWIDANL